MPGDVPLRAVGHAGPIGQHDFVGKPPTGGSAVERPRKGIGHICRHCGVVYLNPVGNCLLCERFTQPVEMDKP